MLGSSQMDWSDAIWFSVPVGSALLAWASYSNAIYAAIQYGEALAVAFDLNRFALYGALHVRTPVNSAAEREFARIITRALATGEPIYDYIPSQDQ